MDTMPKIGDRVLVRFDGSKDEVVRRLDMTPLWYEAFNNVVCEVISVDEKDDRLTILVDGDDSEMWVGLCDIESVVELKEYNFDVQHENRSTIKGTAWVATTMITSRKMVTVRPTSELSTAVLHAHSAEEIDELVALLNKAKEMVYGS